MPQPKKGPRFGGSPAHSERILSNLATELFPARPDHDHAREGEGRPAAGRADDHVREAR